MKKITRQEFKIGDKVKVKNSRYTDYNGKKGTVIDFDLNFRATRHHHNDRPWEPNQQHKQVEWTYHIQFDDTSNLSEGDTMYGRFSEQDLEASNGITKAVQRTLPYDTCAIQSNIFHKQECPYCNKVCSVELMPNSHHNPSTFLIHEKCKHFKKLGAGMYFIFTKTEEKKSE